MHTSLPTGIGMTAPFLALLIIIAISPLIPRWEKLWHNNITKFFVAGTIGLATALWWKSFGGQAAEDVWKAGHEFVSFMILNGALFIVTGGILIAGDIRATPRNNTIIMAAGCALSSLIGVTGAGLVFGRALLNTNAKRKHMAHSILFAIFLIGNSAGMLLPTGNPPLFLGLLRGVPFTWTLFNLMGPWLLLNGVALFIYYVADTLAYAKESAADLKLDREQIEPLSLHGKLQAIFLGFIVILVAATGGEEQWKSILRDSGLALIALISLVTASKKIYQANKFSFGPILEVGALFFGIFLTLPPAVHLLKTNATSMALGPQGFHWIVAALSAFLDSAPAYVCGFEVAKMLGGENLVAGVPAILLAAITIGACDGGIFSYLGNAINLLLKALADERAGGVLGRTMPSFGAYIGIAVGYMLPPVFAVSLIAASGSALLSFVGYNLLFAIVLYHANKVWRISLSKGLVRRHNARHGHP